jgi:hypothetical protein
VEGESGSQHVTFGYEGCQGEKSSVSSAMKTQTDDGHSDALWGNDPRTDHDDLRFESSPQPRSSVDSAAQSWRDSPTAVGSDRRDTFATLQTVHSEQLLLVEPNFDEGVLRALCELDVRSPLTRDSGPALTCVYIFWLVWDTALARSHQAEHCVVQSAFTVISLHLVRPLMNLSGGFCIL